MDAPDKPPQLDKLIRSHIWTDRLQEPGEVQEWTAKTKPLGSTFISVVLTATCRLNKPLHFSTILHLDVWILKLLWLVYRFVWRIWVCFLAHETFVANVWSVSVCLCGGATLWFGSHLPPVADSVRVLLSDARVGMSAGGQEERSYSIGSEQPNVLDPRKCPDFVPSSSNTHSASIQCQGQGHTLRGVSPILIKMGSFGMVSLKCVR